MSLPRTDKWRCKDCKASFTTYEATAEHVRLVHQRKPETKAVAEVVGMFNDFEKKIFGGKAK